MEGLAKVFQKVATRSVLAKHLVHLSKNLETHLSKNLETHLVTHLVTHLSKNLVTQLL